MRFAVEDVNAATGAWFGGATAVVVARKLSKLAVTDAVALPERYACSAIEPAVCSVAVESVEVTIQAAGSGCPVGQSFARTVVGEVPVTCRRSCSGMPAV